MSYDIYKTLKQNEDGTFDYEYASSNVFNYDDTRAWYKGEHKPLVSKEFVSVAIAYLAIESLWNGDVFYQATWKDRQKRANAFLNSKGIDHTTWCKLSIPEQIELCRELDGELKQRKSKKRFYVKVQGRWVQKLTKARVFFTFGTQEDAKVFTVYEPSELENKFAGYKNYGVEFIPA